VVWFGERLGRTLIAAGHAAAIAVPAVACAWFGLPWAALAASALAAAFLPVTIAVLRGRDGAALNGTLAGFGALLYAYGIAFALGVRLGSDSP
jgi:1,4-dihydroxy-2-naphthoate octaprenyltransferase